MYVIKKSQLYAIADQLDALRDDITTDWEHYYSAEARSSSPEPGSMADRTMKRAVRAGALAGILRRTANGDAPVVTSVRMMPVAGTVR
ncbi:MAG: hypothetical protein LKG24_00200 [Lacticaseibacillus songhuajiangensis]|jgi:hypothetical protein|nr:hypothetical protein [Lacticaseibacillus songhuajiangensis]